MIVRMTLLALVVLATAACPPRTTSTLAPNAVLERYAKAVKAGDFDAAYELMSLTFRKRYNRKDFAKMLRENPREVKLSVEQLHGKTSEVKIKAQLDYGDGDKLEMVVEKGNWKIATNPIDFYSQRTPAQALRSFVRAIERRRYDIVLRFVPEKWQETMTIEKLRKQWEGDKREEVVRLLKNLKANLNAPIRVSGNSARMPYGDKHEVRFVRESGVWKIEDPD
ncbi:MAG: hypothetical protein KC503_07475 [Myxococcales bacterium]|nr:hypothetical protein [Myxococcales bacterium]